MGVINPGEDNPTLIAGPILVNWNGRFLALEGEHTYNLGVHKSEVLVGPDGTVNGNKKTPQPGKISGKIHVTREFEPYLIEFLGAEDATVSLTLPTGSILTLSKATQTSEGEGSTENGTLDYEFQGVPNFVPFSK